MLKLVQWFLQICKKKDVKSLPTGDRKQTTGDQKYSHDLSVQLIQNVYVLFAKDKEIS